MSAPTSPSAFVTADLRPAVQQALLGPELAALLEQLLTRGWRLRQLRDRVGAVPVQPGPEQDARAVLAELTGLLDQLSPQESYDEELRRRRLAAEEEQRSRHEPASEHDRARWIAAIRSGLTGRARVAFGPPVRLRPDCSLCEAEAEFFVRRDVHLCGPCVDLLAAGEIRQERLTGS